MSGRVLCGVLLAAFTAIQQQALAAETFKPFTLKTAEGVERSLADVLGKATLVVFFFPSCPFCQAALPEIQKIHDAYQAQGLSVVFINAVPEENDLIPAWRTTHGYTVPILLGTAKVQRDYRVVMTPTHVLLDSGGRVLSKRAGYRAGDEQRLRQDVERALGLTP